MLEEYDIQRLREARRTIERVHDYNYGSIDDVLIVKRLETILKKLTYIIEEETVAQNVKNRRANND